MYYFLYASSAVRPFDASELDALLQVSRRNNAAADVSGMLLHHDGSFLQYLEGNEEDVSGVFERISKDPRHHGVFVLDKGSMAARALPSWSMGYEPLDAEQQEQVGGFNLNKADLERALDPELPRSVLSMMRTFDRTSYRFKDN
jgi:hypothetical protein